jgi:hypothetical protein
MSRGLGKVERRILEALQAMQRTYVALWELVLLIDGQVNSLDEKPHRWDFETCQPHPPQREVIPGVGTVERKHFKECYSTEEPRRSVQEAVSRAVRSLARKGLVRREYEGYRPKQLLVYLPGSHWTQLPQAQRDRLWIRAETLGMKRPYRRERIRWIDDKPTLRREAEP